jgi:hypothetical protein
MKPSEKIISDFKADGGDTCHPDLISAKLIHAILKYLDEEYEKSGRNT